VIREALNATVTGEVLENFAQRATGFCTVRANGEAGFQHFASATLHAQLDHLSGDFHANRHLNDPFQLSESPQSDGSSVS
jgi:hypothetical protein